MDAPTVYIAVGANLEPEANVRSALDALRHQLGHLDVSPFYYSAPLRRPEQPWFLNGVLRCRTRLEARDLKYDVLRTVERDLGRRRGEDPHAARPMDLDLLLYGQMRIVERGLVIPDPEIATRAFLAIPLLDLDPGIVLPGHEAPLAEEVEPGMRASLRRAEPLSRDLEQWSKQS